ncbi:MAG: hypothetical protein DMD91_04975 [Candidatus Rokuibacteriota bacterium]|nr:MAG: hypothetical protein DMD91_04975 [Candidatus Rokubacteria bacterium]
MTRMAETDGPEHAYDEEPQRSIFSALWFRTLIVILVLGVIAAVAVPYVLDFVNPPVVKKAASTPSRAPSPAPPPGATEPASAPPALPPPSAPSAQAPPAPASAPPAVTAAIPAKPTEPPRPVEAKKPGADTAKMATAVEPRKPAAAKAAPAAPSAAKTTAAAMSSGGPFWVQVGAFKSQATAKQLAARLREQSYRVEESVKDGNAGAIPAASADTGGAGDRYNVFVSGSAPSDLAAKLSSKGLAADPVAGGVVVKPSLPLRDAVALSRDLATDGLKVHVRRVGGEVSAPVATAPAADTLYRVRVGGLADRAAALATAKELEGKGYKPFIGRGGS